MLPTSPRGVREEVPMLPREAPEKLVELRLLHIAVTGGVEQVETLQQPDDALDGLDAAADLLSQVLPANGPRDVQG